MAFYVDNTCIPWSHERRPSWILKSFSEDIYMKEQTALVYLYHLLSTLLSELAICIIDKGPIITWHFTLILLVYRGLMKEGPGWCAI